MLKNVLSTRELLSDNSDRNDSSSFEASQQPYSQFDFSQLNTQDLLSQPLVTNSQVQDAVQARQGALYERWLGKSSEGKLYDHRDSMQALALKRPQLDKGSQQQVPNHYLKAKIKDERDFMQQTMTAVKDLTSETVKALQEIKEHFQEENAESTQTVRATVSSFLASQDKHQSALLEVIQDRESRQQQIYESETRIAQKDGEIQQLKEKLRGENEAKTLLAAVEQCRKQSESIALMLQEHMGSAESHRRRVELELGALAEFSNKCLAALSDQAQLKSLERRILEGVKEENRTMTNEVVQANKENLSERDRAAEEAVWLKTHIQDEMRDLKQAFLESMVKVREETFHQRQMHESELKKVEVSIKNQLQEQMNQMKEILRQRDLNTARSYAESEGVQTTRKMFQDNAQPQLNISSQCKPNSFSHEPAGFKLPSSYRYDSGQSGSLTKHPMNGYSESVDGDFGKEKRGDLTGKRKAFVWTRDPRRQQRTSYPGQATWPAAGGSSGKDESGTVMKQRLITSDREKQTYLISPQSLSPLAIMYSRTQTQHKQVLSNRQNPRPTNMQMQQMEPSSDGMGSTYFYAHQQNNQGKQSASVVRSSSHRFLMRPPLQREKSKGHAPFEWEDSDSEGSSMLNPTRSTARNMQSSLPPRQFLKQLPTQQSVLAARAQYGVERFQDDDDSDDDPEEREGNKSTTSQSRAAADVQSVSSWLEQAKRNNRQGMLQRAYQRIAQQHQTMQETRQIVTRSSAKKQHMSGNKADQSPRGPPEKQRKTASSFP